ncbi:sigma-70 family RNA polymerase sigma factor [Phaeobacter sp. HF9A]|uniref:sigma-70 family RNA polymerase sigma factor n=1 Tax=Phaeobacter sp. HF9A TaxID=2721561 RepID=UPI0014313376|nr:sigma-70 family RNA polymerase sigma factor [Phaeobacter sp. HF9A]NIZ12304.1 sigma-70 family RNA polymerase sigma factor [Phaeobacter sp. HF9A]
MSEHAHRPVREMLIHELVTRRRLHLCTALKLVGSMDAAEDVLQNTALKCLSGPPRTAPEKPDRYVARMVRNAAVDYLRKTRKEIAMPFEEESQLALAGTTPLCGQTCLEWKQQLSAVTGALRALPARKRDAFLRHRLSEVPQKQIAQELQVSRTLVNFIIKDAQNSCAQARARASAQDMASQLPANPPAAPAARGRRPGRQSPEP